jgi:chromosome segregation ATPase
MRFNPLTNLPKVNNGIEAEYLRLILTVLILFAVLFVFAGVVVFVTRSQNPSCADLRKRVDDATRAYQTVLTQSQSIDRNYTSYQSAITKIRSDLIANDKRRQQAERDIDEAQRDRARCERDPAVLAAGACADVSHRLDTAEKRLAYVRANQTRLETDLAANQQRLVTTRAALAALGANLTTAQQDLDAVNQALASAGCGSENRSK